MGVGGHVKEIKKFKGDSKGFHLSHFGVVIYCHLLQGSRESGFYWIGLENQALSYGHIRFEKIILHANGEVNGQLDT